MMWLLILSWGVGYFLYVLLRAGSAFRSGETPSRWEYVRRNWDWLLITAGITMPLYAFAVRQEQTFFSVLTKLPYMGIAFGFSAPICIWGFGVGCKELKQKVGLVFRGKRIAENGK